MTIKLNVQLALLASSNIVLTFMFQWYIFARLGAGLNTDALFAGMTVPQLVLTAVSGSLMHVLVPLLAGETEARFRHDAWSFFLLVGGSFTAFSLVLYLTAPWWTPLTVPGFGATAQQLTVELTRIQLIGMVFTALSGVQWAVCHARQQFIWAEMSPLLAGGAALLLLIWALPKYGVAAAAWISTLRYLLQTLVMMPAMGSFVRPDFNAPTMRQAWRRIKPLLIGTVYYKTDPLVDRFLLSMSGAGSLSLFYLGQQIYGAGNAVLNKAVSAPLVPKMSMLHKAGDLAGFRKTYRKKLVLIVVSTSAGLLGFAILGQPALELLVGWGAFRVEDVHALWLVMLGLAGMLVGGAAGQITSSSFYALGDTVTPTRLGVISYTVFIPLKVGAFIVEGVVGIALASSCFFMANLFMQWIFLEKSLEERNESQ